MVPRRLHDTILRTTHACVKIHAVTLNREAGWGTKAQRPLNYHPCYGSELIAPEREYFACHLLIPLQSEDASQPRGAARDRCLSGTEGARGQGPSSVETAVLVLNQGGPAQKNTFVHHPRDVGFCHSQSKVSLMGKDKLNTTRDMIGPNRGNRSGASQELLRIAEAAWSLSPLGYLPLGICTDIGGPADSTVPAIVRTLQYEKVILTTEEANI